VFLKSDRELTKQKAGPIKGTMVRTGERKEKEGK